MTTQPMTGPTAASESARPRGVRRILLESGYNLSAFVLAVPALGAVEKHTQRIFAKLGLLPDDAAHRRVLAVVRYLRAG